MSRAGVFIIGLLVGIIVIVPLGAYLFAKLGGIAMATTAKPLPLEQTFAKTALNASLGGAAKMNAPLQQTDENMTAGAHVYVENCAICHGLPDQPKTRIAAGEFPSPPQLFDPQHMVTDDPEGVTHWKVAHGIRLSGMPGFGSSLNDTEQWQVTMLLAHADKLPAAARSVLSNAAAKAVEAAKNP